MKYSKKQIMSLILSGALVTSLGETTIIAADGVNSRERNYDVLYTLDSYNLNGLYTTYVDNMPIYVNLNNNLVNKYLDKNEALNVGYRNYNNVFIYSKTVENPDYIKGYSLLNEKNITIYALSDKTYVNGWTRVNYLSNNEKVATTIELGEFLLKRVKLDNYKNNTLGFANIDINRDGYSELVYLGNNKENKLLSKSEAINWANQRYNNYYIESKTVYDSSINRNVVIYAISDTYYVNGWTVVNKNYLPNDETIATNPEFYDALIRILNNRNTLTIDRQAVKPSNNVVPNNNYSYNYMIKDKALDYAYNHYSNFCILAKSIINPQTKEKEVLYAFSTSVKVDGWVIIGNDFIPKNEKIFLSMNDAYNYEYLLNNNYIKTLK